MLNSPEDRKHQNSASLYSLNVFSAPLKFHRILFLVSSILHGHDKKYLKTCDQLFNPALLLGNLQNFPRQQCPDPVHVWTEIYAMAQMPQNLSPDRYFFFCIMGCSSEHVVMPDNLKTALFLNQIGH